MTRTTELLKEIETINKKSMIFQDDYDKRNILKSELKGRLDALKDEEEFLRLQFSTINTIDFEENDSTCIIVRDNILNRLASIREEIKLIENGI